MKILHLETGRHFYGGARQVACLANGLAARGIGNVVACTPGHALAAQADGAEVIELPLAGDLDLSLTRRLGRLIATHRPDLVHVHSRRGADTFGGRAARAAGVPAVLTRRVQSAEPGFWFRWKARPYAAVVAISAAVRAELGDLGIAADRLRLIRSAVDTTAFHPDAGGAARARLIERYALPSDGLFAGMAAQFIARKGHDLALPLVTGIRAAVPGFRLLLFGDGPTRSRFERQALEQGLTDRVRFCGYEPDWPNLLPGLDLLLHPARREGLGAVVLEAMSAGVPVVASAVGGIVDAIESGIDGVLLPPDEVDTWTQSVARLLGNADERQRLALAGRRKVEAAFTIGRMTDAYIELYRELLNRDG